MGGLKFLKLPVEFIEMRLDLGGAIFQSVAFGLGLFAVALNPLQGNDQFLEMCACLPALGLQMLEVLA